MFKDIIKYLGIEYGDVLPIILYLVVMGMNVKQSNEF